MAAAAAALTTKGVGDSIVVDARIHHIATIVAECTQAPSAPACAADSLFERLLVGLEEEQFSFWGFPITEEILWGMLHELVLQAFWIAENYARRFMQKSLKT